MYIPEEQTIFISNSQKKNFLIKYLNDNFKKTFTLKEYFVSPKDFVKEISSLKKISFVGRDKNLFNGDVFKGVGDIFGYGEAVSFAISINIHDSKFDPKKCLDFLCLWKNKKEKIDKMICIGESDDGVEKLFNLETFSKRIDISATKNSNEMYDPESIKSALLEKLCMQNTKK